MKNCKTTSERDLSFDIRELSRDLCAEYVSDSIVRTGEPDLESEPGFVADYLKSQFVELILAEMKKQGLSKTDLARKLDKSPQYVSRILNEKANFTIESMAAISCALRMTLEIRMHDKGLALQGRDTAHFNPIRTEEFKTGKNSDESLIPASVDSVHLT